MDSPVGTGARKLAQAQQQPIEKGHGLGVVDMAQVVESDHAMRKFASLERVDERSGRRQPPACIAAGGHRGQVFGRRATSSGA